MKKTRFHLLLVLTLMLTQACATIMLGRTQELDISSSPSRASVTINDQQLGRTPLTVDLKRADTHTINIALDGYDAYEITLTRKITAWAWGNIIWGGFIGLAIDAVSGGLYKLTPEDIHADLRQSKQIVQNKSGDGIFIVVVLEANPAWERIDTLTATTN